MTPGEGIMVEARTQGYILSVSFFLVNSIFNENKKANMNPADRISLQKKCEEEFNSLLPDAPQDFIDDILKIGSIDALQIHDVIEKIYYKYLSYLENTPLYEEAYKAALDYLHENQKIEGYSAILEWLSGIKSPNCADSDLTICIRVSNTLDKQADVSLLPSVDTKTRVAVAEKLINDDKIITLDTEASIDSIAKKLVAEETDDYRIYKFNSFYIRFRNHMDYEIFEIVNIDTTKLWYVMKNNLGEEILQYFTINDNNELFPE
ncbi:hypothetical protein [Pseudobutyrivibrio sp. LB2011]|uniref:hypothetical protein n=1 Tax=Pseudobutyrivibrio sp. LB2011 TaxID=1408312 RepID=UPI0005D204B9|nr:hypothetical protein [Pseudobutyrivibrio sp. LB2011]